MVKICGITNREDAQAAVDAGAGAIGFNFYAASPRYISPTDAATIGVQLPSNVLKVGVFVNESREAVSNIAGEAGLDVAQLHGSSECIGLPVWRAVPVADGEMLNTLLEEAAEAFLLDAAAPGMYGGTGRSFDWHLARNLNKNIILAGGLDEHNVGTAIAEAMPWGVDACSRLECSPGRKDHTRMRRFIEAALAARS